MESKCPICKKPTVYEFRPFCSKRCAQIDLGHWFRGDYKIEGEEVVEDEEGGKEEEKSHIV